MTDDVGGIVATGTGAGTSDSDVINVTVNAVADIVADTLTTTEDNAVIANVITGTNGASADNFEAAAVIQSVTQGTNGAVTFLANGEVTYTPNDDFNGVRHVPIHGAVGRRDRDRDRDGEHRRGERRPGGRQRDRGPDLAVERRMELPGPGQMRSTTSTATCSPTRHRWTGNPLPAWLTFNGANRTFTGTPPLDFVGQLALKVTASDASSSVSDTFNLDIVQSPSPDINLSEGDDNFIGTGLGEVINGLGGNDNIQGGAGNDRINGNAGNDNIDGGSGANVLHGNDGGDRVIGIGNLNTSFGDDGAATSCSSSATRTSSTAARATTGTGSAATATPLPRAPATTFSARAATATRLPARTAPTFCSRSASAMRCMARPATTGWA